MFRSRIGSLRKGLKSRAEFLFADAPFEVQPDAADAAAVGEGGGDSGTQGRSWWQWSDVEPGTRPSRAAHYTGWEASQAAIAAALEQHAPIDGLLGFSQGATAAALFLAHARPGGEQQHEQQQQHEQHEQHPKQAEVQAEGQATSLPSDPAAQQLRFAVVIAGFLPRDASYAAALQAGAPALCTLHVCGAADQLVPEERSAALWSCFAPGSVLRYNHPGAHMVPTCSGEFKAALVSLLDDVKAGRLHQAQQQQQQQQQRKGGQGAAAAEAAGVVEAAAPVGKLSCS